MLDSNKREECFLSSANKSISPGCISVHSIARRLVDGKQSMIADDGGLMDTET